MIPFIKNVTNNNKMIGKIMKQSFYITIVCCLFIHLNYYNTMHYQALAGELDPLSSGDFMTEENIESAREQYKKLARERLFGDLKGKQSDEQPANPNKRLFVPSAILQEYTKFRDRVRDVVPSDRDFYGKIDLDELHDLRKNHWTKDANGILVDMGQPNQDLDGERLVFDKEVSHITLIQLSRDPDDVAADLEPYLHPHTHDSSNQKFLSVHLNFNLSQIEVFAAQTAADDLIRAELRLTRESIFDCELKICPKKPIPFFPTQQQESKTSRRGFETGQLSHEVDEIPKIQRIYLLQVNGRDDFGELTTVIFTARLARTRETTPLLFDVTPIVKNWLLNPKTNHGIIVRVQNVDPVNSGTGERRLEASKINSHSSSRQRSIRPPLNYVEEHIRLKHTARFASDSEETWRDKQPSLMIWSKPRQLETTRRHVKRHYAEENMQADEPDTADQVNAQTSTTTQKIVHSTTSTTSPEKSSSITTTSEPINKRDHVTTSTRRQPGRASSSGRSSNEQNSRAKTKSKASVRQAEKCTRRSLNINFQEVGWNNWIIAPTSYNAYYCAGDCNWPLSDTQNSTNHAIIQSIYNSVGRLVPKSRCAPVKLGEMAILYQLDNVVQIRRYDDMIVEACGCL